MLSYYEAVKMIVCMLGYEQDALEEGYPKGYMNVANKLGIILYPNIEDRAINFDEYATILYKAIDVPLKVKISFGSEDSYTVMDGKDAELQTIRSKYLSSID